MTNRNVLFIIIFCISISFILFTCTKNPISGKKLNSNDQIIKGKVVLTDGSKPDNVVIWLEGLKVFTTTDENGAFQLLLPPAESQPGGGLSGNYQLYCYIGNYEIKSFSIALVNGLLVYGHGHIDNDGNISKIITLQKLIDIKTTVQPAEIPEYDYSLTGITFFVTVSIVPHIYPIHVELPLGPNEWLTCMIFKGVDGPITDAVLYGKVESTVTKKLFGPNNYEIGVKARQLSPQSYFTLEAGEYEVVPYIRVIQDDLPADLLKSLGENADSYHHDYLKIPFKREVGHLTVKAD